MPDPVRDPGYEVAREALSDPLYEAAFLKAAQGQESLLTEAERAAAERAKRASGHWGTPGWPVPASMDPTLRAHEPSDEDLRTAGRALLDQLEQRFGPLPEHLRAEIEARWTQEANR